MRISIRRSGLPLAAIAATALLSWAGVDLAWRDAVPGLFPLFFLGALGCPVLGAVLFARGAGFLVLRVLPGGDRHWGRVLPSLLSLVPLAGWLVYHARFDTDLTREVALAVRLAASLSAAPPPELP